MAEHARLENVESSPVDPPTDGLRGSRYSIPTLKKQQTPRGGPLPKVVINESLALLLYLPTSLGMNHPQQLRRSAAPSSESKSVDRWQAGLDTLVGRRRGRVQGELWEGTQSLANTVPEIEKSVLTDTLFRRYWRKTCTSSHSEWDRWWTETRRKHIFLLPPWPRNFKRNKK